jgi:Tol biopolymer transport system component
LVFNEMISIVVPPPAVSQDSTFTVVGPFWSVDGSKILFFGHVFGLEGYDLYEVDSSGGVARMVMHDTLAKSEPALSPDGKELAYLAAPLDRLLCCAHVWGMEIDGTNPRDLTPFGGNFENLRWSPDSRFVIFNGGVQDSGVINYQIFRVDFQSGDAQLLTRGNFGNLDASYFPNGQEIAFVSGRIMTDYGGDASAVYGTIPPSGTVVARRSHALDSPFDYIDVQ